MATLDDFGGDGAADARSETRYEVDAYVNLLAGQPTPQPIQNISLGGICIQTKTLNEVGAIVDVVVKFPDLGHGSEIAVRGQVVWANRQPPPDVGIRWVELDDSRRTLLAQYIDRVRVKQRATESYLNLEAQALLR